MSTRPLLLPLLSALLLLAACNKETQCSDGQDNDNDYAVDCNDADCISDPACGGSGDDDDDSVPSSETQCEDGLDNDADGATDCADSDCLNLHEWCAWPTEVDILANFWLDFTIWGAPDDCAIEYLTTAPHNPAESCPGCDRVYCGNYNYTGNDTCPTGDGFNRPPSGCTGLTFTSENSWQVWYRDGQGNWASMGQATNNGGSYTVQAQETMNHPDYGNIGTLTTTYTITP